MAPSWSERLGSLVKGALQNPVVYVPIVVVGGVFVTVRLFRLCFDKDWVLDEDQLAFAAPIEGRVSEEREELLADVFCYMLGAIIPKYYGAIPIATRGHEAVAIWYPKGRDIGTLTLLVHFHGVSTYRFCGYHRRGRLEAVSQAIRARKMRHLRLNEADSSKEYYYLFLVAVRADVKDPEKYMSAVIDPVTQRADAQGRVCYTQVTTPEHSTFLQAKCGFTLVETFKLFEIDFFVLKRDPRTV